MGPLQLSIKAAARCLVQPHALCLESILRAMLRDESISWRKVFLVCDFLTAIAWYESKTGTYVDAGVIAMMTRLQFELLVYLYFN